MFTHVMVGSNDLPKSRRFYDAVMGALGYKNAMPADAPRCAYRTDTGAFLVGKPGDGGAACHANGGMVSFGAADSASVDAFHAAGLANGGIDEGAPGTRTGSGRPMYGAYLRDPDGNKIAAFARPAA
jgi:catechol 2,3-dioxygenase-like lactoylglutathione lyase family enzyme